MSDKATEYEKALRLKDWHLADDGHCPHPYEPFVPVDNQCYVCGEKREHRHHRTTGTFDPHTGERIERTFYEEPLP